ncbi:MAG: helix-turn-helix domain-containing protein [Leptolyngbyaceae cyanobacterium bins.349]|nr:helix-turn-helix domain-containing protein [Leptolyngbyaceae cyanobacterium bins.349]
MNQTSLEKIQAAAVFLRYFRRCLPTNIQAIVRPYLDQPYQLALNILDCCDGPDGCTAEEIAQRLTISKSSVRQVLSALREGGLVFMVSAAKGWSPLEPETLDFPTTFPIWSRSASSIPDGKGH